MAIARIQRPDLKPCGAVPTRRGSHGPHVGQAGGWPGRGQDPQHDGVIGDRHPSWPATAWPQARISTWRRRPWSPRTIWRRWGRPCASAVTRHFYGMVRASSKRRSRARAGRTSASWRPRAPPSIVRPPALKRLRARWPSMARHIGPWSCLPRPRTNGDCRGWLGQYTPLLRGSRRSCGWRKRTRMSVKRMPRVRPRGSVPVSPPITTWGCAWKHDRRYGRGRPRQHTPRAVNTRRYGLQCPRNARDATLVRTREEAGCVVWLTHVPPAGDLGPPRRGWCWRGSKNQQGIEPHVSLPQRPADRQSAVAETARAPRSRGAGLLVGPADDGVSWNGRSATMWTPPAPQ